MNQETIFILEYMQSNISTITLAHLAQFFHYSERQMQRLIQSATGMSFGENVRRLRMHRAQELLLNPGLRISDIAAHLGYTDVSSFRQAFRRAFGMTPQEYSQRGARETGGEGSR